MNQSRVILTNETSICIILKRETPSLYDIHVRELIYNYVLLIQYCAGDTIEKNEMGWACGAYG